jgi:tripartite-type tricarboxylate transporter receptor subunit TctC
MSSIKKTWLLAALVLLAQPWFGASWSQEKYPNKPVRIVVPVGPGSSADLLARFLADYLRRDLQTEFVIDNKTGAGGVLAGDFVAKSKPDGYTLALFNASVVTTVTVVNSNVSYDPIKDFTPIATLVTNPLTLIVNAGSKWNTLEQLLDDARKAPGKLACGIIGVGSHTHFNLELLKIASAADINRIPYTAGTGPIISALLGGHIACASLAWAAVESLVKGGKFRGLAVTSTIKDYPQIPTFASKGFPQASLEVFFALFGPARLPQEVMDRLLPAVDRIMTRQEDLAKIEKMGFSILYEAPGQLAERLRREVAVVREVARTASIKEE